MDTERRRRTRPGMERPVRALFILLPSAFPHLLLGLQRRGPLVTTSSPPVSTPTSGQSASKSASCSSRTRATSSCVFPSSTPYSIPTTDKRAPHVGVEPAPPAHDPRIDLPGARGVRPGHAPSTHGQRRARRRREPTSWPWRAPQQRARAQLPARENPRAGQSD